MDIGNRSMMRRVGFLTALACTVGLYVIISAIVIGVMYVK